MSTHVLLHSTGSNQCTLNEKRTYHLRAQGEQGLEAQDLPAGISAREHSVRWMHHLGLEHRWTLGRQTVVEYGVK